MPEVLDIKESYKYIEELNINYIILNESPEYRLGHKIRITLQELRQLHLLTVLRKIFNSYYVPKFLSLPYDMSPPILIHTPSKGKVVVYSCIAGPYDLPKEPLLPEPNVDYVLYTDQPKHREDTVWQFRDIPEKVMQLSPNGKVRNEYIRTHPHEFFAEYDYSIYIDGSFQIVSDVSAWTNLISPNVGLAMHQHSCCSCVYKEGKRILHMKVGRAKGLCEQLKFFRKDGMPMNIGRLLETGVIVTDLHCANAQAVFDLWWNDFYRWNSQRDQVSLPYVLWKLKISMDDVGSLGGNVWRNPKLRYYPHQMKEYSVKT